MRTVLNANITESAKEQLRSYLARPREFRPTLVFLKGRELSESSDYWTYNVYGPRNMPRLGALILWLLKHPVLYSCDGFDVYIPQRKFVGELDGKLLNVTHGQKLVVLERA